MCNTTTIKTQHLLFLQQMCATSCSGDGSGGDGGGGEGGGGTYTSITLSLSTMTSFVGKTGSYKSIEVFNFFL